MDCRRHQRHRHRRCRRHHRLHRCVYVGVEAYGSVHGQAGSILRAESEIGRGGQEEEEEEQWQLRRGLEWEIYVSLLRKVTKGEFEER